jgi:hypothetical protein
MSELFKLVALEKRGIEGSFGCPGDPSLVGNFIIPTDVHSMILQRGWFNHQPDINMI